MNHDGPGSGLTVPNPRARRWCSRPPCVRRASIPGRRVRGGARYGHATRRSNRTGGARQGLLPAATGEPLLVGSIKTNIGHTDRPAGIAGLIKTVLILQHAEVPPSLHCATPTQAFAWDDLRSS